VKSPTKFVSLAVLCCTASVSLAESNQPLRLIQSISLTGVEGRIDHMAVDLAGQRLFVAALENGSVEVIELRSGKRVRSLGGFREPQGVEFVPSLARLVVASGDGTCEILDGTTLRRVRSLHFSSDADNVRYDGSTRRIYVGYGEGALAVLDALTGDRLGDIPLRAHPESFQLQTAGPRVFVNVPAVGEVAIIDRIKGSEVGRWKIDGFTANYPMALDELGHRLFVGCRHPAAVLVFDDRSGRRLAAVPIEGDSDDLFYDAATGRLLASCGSGFIEVLEMGKSGQFTRTAKVPTAVGARTALFLPTLRRLYLAVPHRGSQRAEIRVFEVVG
jgi:DNA-binding beta-propeller fold protein YncE